MNFARKIYLHQRLGIIFCRWYILVAAFASFCSTICTENLFAPTTWCNIFRILENNQERAIKHQERAIRGPERVNRTQEQEYKR